MAIQLSDVSNALKKVILPYIQDNFNKQTILLDQVKRNQGVTFMNDYFYAPIRSGRHGGVTNLADDGNALVSGSSSLGQAYVPVKIITGTFDISKLAIDATKTSKGAVENQLTFQARTLASDFAKDINRQFMGDGYGVISEVAGSTGAGTMTVQLPSSSCDDGRVQDRYGEVNGDIAAAEYIFPGQVLGIGTAGADLGTVSSVSGTTVVMTGAPAIVANDAIYRVDGSGEGAGTAEITGIGIALGTSTTYANVTRTTIPSWTPQRDTTAEALSLSAIEDKYLSAKKYANMGDRYAIFMNKTLYKKYGDLLTSMRRAVNETQLLGGWTGLEFAVGGGKVGVFLDYDVPDGEVLILNLDTWTIAQVSDMNWMEDPSGSLVRKTGYITYQATMAWFMNMMCLAPAANAILVRKTD